MTDNGVLTVFVFGIVLGAAVVGPLAWLFGWLRGMRQWRDDRGGK